LSKSIYGSWRRFLIEVELARNYPMPFALNAAGAAFRNPILEQLLPSLLHIKAVAILDAALKEVLATRNLSVPRTYGGGLKARIEFLNERGLLHDVTLLHRIRELRNDVAHEFDERVTWTVLNGDLATIHAVLQSFGLVGPRPHFEAFAERSGACESTEPDVLFAFDHTFGVREGTKIVAQITWTENVMRDDA